MAAQPMILDGQTLWIAGCYACGIIGGLAQRDEDYTEAEARYWAEQVGASHQRLAGHAVWVGYDVTRTEKARKLPQTVLWRRRRR